MFCGDLDETRKMQRCWRHERPVPDIYTSAYKVLFAGSVKFNLDCEMYVCEVWSVEMCLWIVSMRL